MAKAFHGRIEDTLDALVILEACRQGVLPRLTRRLCAAERGEPLKASSATTETTVQAQPGPSGTEHRTTNPAPVTNLITPGSVFVFDEKETGIHRWTDGRIWTPSRICGNFLVYHELFRKLPEQICKTADDKAKVRDGSGLKDKGLRQVVEKDGLVVRGSTKGTFVLKKDGLIKKTLCVRGISLPPPADLQNVSATSSRSRRNRGARAECPSVPGLSIIGTQHLVCYEKIGGMEGLHRPRDYVELRDLPLSSAFIKLQKFRDPISILPLPPGIEPIEPLDQYVRQDRIVDPKSTKISSGMEDTHQTQTLNAKRKNRPVAASQKGSTARKFRSNPYPSRTRRSVHRTLDEESLQMRSAIDEFNGQTPSFQPRKIHDNDGEDNNGYSRSYDGDNNSNFNNGSDHGNLEHCNDAYSKEIESQQCAAESVTDARRHQHNKEFDGDSQRLQDHCEASLRIRGFKTADGRWEIRRSTFKEILQDQHQQTSEDLAQEHSHQGDTNLLQNIDRHVNEMQWKHQRESQHHHGRYCADADECTCSCSNISSPSTCTNSLSSSLSLSPSTEYRNGWRVPAVEEYSTDYTLSTGGIEPQDPPTPPRREYQRMSVSPSAEEAAHTLLGHDLTVTRSKYQANTSPESSRYSLSPIRQQGINSRLDVSEQCIRTLLFEPEHELSYAPSVTEPALAHYQQYSSTIAHSEVPPPWWQHQESSNVYEGSRYNSSTEYPSFNPDPTPQCSTPDKAASIIEGHSVSIVHSVGSSEHSQFPRNEPEETPQQMLRFHTRTRSQQGLGEANLFERFQQERERESLSSRSVDQHRQNSHHPASVITSSPMDTGYSEHRYEGYEVADSQQGSPQSSEKNSTGGVNALIEQDRSLVKMGAHDVKLDFEADQDHCSEQNMSDSTKTASANESSGHVALSMSCVSSLYNGTEEQRKRRRISTIFLSRAIDYRVEGIERGEMMVTPTRAEVNGKLHSVPAISHIHFYNRRRSTAIEHANLTFRHGDTIEELLYSHEQPVSFEILRADTLASERDEPPSAHLGSEEDPFFSDIRARGIGGKSCLAVHAGSSSS
ncbi:hypothetical protein BGZ94_001171 [Podila epigama]|nr:hypothetical protein BGZ94_001171 [Podila epigama]